MPPPRGRGGFGQRQGKRQGPRRASAHQKGSKQLFKRRKFCRFTAEKIEWIDYKDVDLLKDFIGENGKIIPARESPERAPITSGSSRPRSSARAISR